jgi:hypothetical protein
MAVSSILIWMLLALGCWLVLIPVFIRAGVPWPSLNAAVASWIVARVVLLAGPQLLHWLRALRIQ